MTAKMRLQLSIFLSAVIMAGAAGAVAEEPLNRADNQQKDSYVKTLDQYGIPATKVGLTNYLKTLVPSDEERQQYSQRVAALVALLGDKDFNVREQATRDLAASADLPADVIEAAFESDDPEVIFRAEAILRAIEHQENRVDSIQLAVFKTIERQQLRDMAEIVVAVIPELEESYVVSAATAALEATVEPDDVPRLREWLRHPNINVRISSVAALASLQGASSTGQLREMLDDQEPRVRLAVARSLASLGDRSSLQALEKLLGNDELAIRTEAIMILRALTDQRFDFIPSSGEAERIEAVRRWSQWIQETGQTAELAFPLNLHGAEVGHTLVLLYGQSTMVELDETGNEIARLGNLNFPWAVQQLPNGNRLIGSYRGKFLAEFDAAGKEVWRKDNMPGGVFGVQRLENGNTLAACHNGNCVMEVDPAGKIAWQVKVDGNPMDAQRLENGNTLVALSSGRSVVEVDREGKVVWKIGGLGIPRTAVRLANGNTLVCDFGKRRVDEFDPAGESVWAIVDLASPFSAQRLSNGQTLITVKQGLRIYDDDGNIVWEKELAGVGRAIRY